MQKIFKNNANIHKKLLDNNLKKENINKINSPLVKNHIIHRNFAFWDTFKYQLKENVNKDPELKEKIDNFKESRDKFMNRYSIPKRLNQAREWIEEIPRHSTKISKFIGKYSGYTFFMDNFSIHSFRMRLSIKEAANFIRKPIKSYEDDLAQMQKDDVLDKYSDVFRRRYKQSQYIPTTELVGAPLLLFYYLRVADKIENFALWMEEKMLRKFVMKEEGKDQDSVRNTLKNWEHIKRRMFLTEHNEVGLIVYSGETRYLGYLRDNPFDYKGEKDYMDLDVLAEESNEGKTYDFKIEEVKETKHEKSVFLYEDGDVSHNWGPYNPFGYVETDMEFHKNIVRDSRILREQFTEWVESLDEIDDTAFYRPASFLKVVKVEEPTEEEKAMKERQEKQNDILNMVNQGKQEEKQKQEEKLNQEGATDTETLNTSSRKVINDENSSYTISDATEDNGEERDFLGDYTEKLKIDDVEYYMEYNNGQPNFEKFEEMYPKVDMQKVRDCFVEFKRQTGPIVTIDNNTYRRYSKEIEEEEDKKVREAEGTYVSEKYVIDIEDYLLPLQYPEIMDHLMSRTYYQRSAQMSLLVYVSKEEQLARQQHALEFTREGLKPIIKVGHLLTKSKYSGLHNPAPPIKDATDLDNYLYEYRMTHPDYVNMMERLNIMEVFIKRYKDYCIEKGHKVPTDIKQLRKEAFKHCYNYPGFYKRTYFPPYIPKFFGLPEKFHQPKHSRIRPFNFHVLRIGNSWPAIDWEDPYYSKFKALITDMMQDEEIFKRMYPTLSTEEFQLLRETDNIFKPKLKIDDDQYTKRYEKFTAKWSKIDAHPDYKDFILNFEDPWSTRWHKLHDSYFENYMEQRKDDLMMPVTKMLEKANKKKEKVALLEEKLNKEEENLSQEFLDLAQVLVEKKFENLHQEMSSISVDTNVEHSYLKYQEIKREMGILFNMKKILKFSRDLHEQEHKEEIRKEEDLVQIIDETTENLRSFEQQILGLSGRKTLPMKQKNVISKSTTESEVFAKHALGSKLEIINQRKRLYLNQSQSVSLSTGDDELTPYEKQSVISFLNEQLTLQESLLEEAEMDPGLLNQYIDSAPLFYFTKRVRQTHHMINQLNDYEFENLVASSPEEWQTDLKALKRESLEKIMDKINNDYSIDSFGSFLFSSMDGVVKKSLEESLTKRVEKEREIMRLKILTGVEDESEILKIQEEKELQEKDKLEKLKEEQLRKKRELEGIDFLKILTPYVIPNDTPKEVRMKRLDMDLIFNDLRYSDDIAPLPSDHPMSGQVVISDDNNLNKKKDEDTFFGVLSEKTHLNELGIGMKKLREKADNSDNPLLQLASSTFRVIDQQREKRKASKEKKRNLDKMFQMIFFHDPGFTFEKFSDSVYKTFFPNFIAMWYNFEMDKLKTYFSGDYLENAQSQLNTFMKAEGVKPQIIQQPAFAEIIDARDDPEYGQKIIIVQVDYIRTAVGVIDVRTGQTVEQMKKEAKKKKEKEEREKKEKLEKEKEEKEKKASIEGTQQEQQQQQDEIEKEKLRLEGEEKLKKEKEEEEKKKQSGLTVEKTFGFVEGATKGAFGSSPTVHAKGLFIFGFDERKGKFVLLTFRENIGMGVF
eukprot:TRINITY_DN5575_c1_g1_i1.p1 TRINITY_DN5575_c1_g1~~TRINITY_DN5575_c1_g1_i1.p1  ORF type:complete len:1599 (-),score=612.11 TRINITY_DN5575_c1_g1_i1:101-4897(-)